MASTPPHDRTAAPAPEDEAQAASKLRTVQGRPALVTLSTPGFDQTNSLVLFPAHLEFLYVHVQFHRRSVPDLPVRFFSRDGAQVGPDVTTDKYGYARVARRVPAGSYVCEIERQPKTLVSSVLDPNTVYPVVLPVGRPYSDINERAEFVRPTARPKK